MKKTTNDGDKLTGTVLVLVLGPLDHSPRMLNHVLSITNEGWPVQFAGYIGAEHEAALGENVDVEFIEISDPDRLRYPWALRSGLRFLGLGRQVIRLVFGERDSIATVLVQSPPALPTLPALLTARVLARIFGGHRIRIVIDWHNLGYTRLAERFRSGSLAVRFYRLLEKIFGRRADGHICVSQSMKVELERTFGLCDVHVFYDRPSERYAGSDIDESRLAFLSRIIPSLKLTCDPTRVFVCPTSWTDDEDTDSLGRTVRALMPENGWPSEDSPLFILTGRGPNLAAFAKRYTGTDETSTLVCGAWLTIEDYHRLLRMADFGICLHRSSSGIDLPMKLADMRGAGLPALAYDYGTTLTERFNTGRDGFLFRTDEELFDHLTCILKDPLPAAYQALKTYGAERNPIFWESAWKREIRSLVAAE